MTISVAKTAGFCFGVDKAVDMVERLLDSGETVCTLGPIIHNPQVVAGLSERGVTIVDSPQKTPADAVLVVRSHGVGQDVYDCIEQSGVRLCDATCPFVSKIHRIAAQESAQGAIVLIAGDEGHPEVVGIRGHCAPDSTRDDGLSSSYVFASEGELVNTLKIIDKNPGILFIVTAQTTFNASIWEKCVKYLKKHYTNAKIFDTICSATSERQAEAIELAQSCDRMFIVGGRQSSNTAKLFDVSAAHCTTYLVESAAELQKEMLYGSRKAGLTAGASTPSNIIKEVLSTMTEIMNNENEAMVVENPQEEQPVVNEAVTETAAQEETVQTEKDDAAVAEQVVPAKSFEEMSFEEALEASLQSLNTDDRVRGTVVRISPNEIQVDVGRKQAGYIPIDELSAGTVTDPNDFVKIGDELELLIMRTNDQEGTIMLSKKRVDAMKGWDIVVEAETSGEILEGLVTDIIKGGVLAVTNGVRIFIPASQASVVRMEDLTPLKGQHVRLRIIETNKSRRRAVGSVRAVSREERKEKESVFWAQAAVGQRYTGTVKSLTSYGAFVDIGGVDGMVHISELSWSRVKHPSDVVSVGDTVEVYIRDLDNEKMKISLGYRKDDENPWEKFKAAYPIGSVVEATVVGMTAFGAFAQIMPGIDGLIHISQIAGHRVEKPQDVLKVGEVVTVKITNIDYDTKRISLSIRELLEKVEEVTEDTSVEETAAE